jgi:hypothetical protein
MAEIVQQVARHVIFSGAHLHLEYNGPALSDLLHSTNPRVVVAFAPFDYLPPEEAEGWGSRSFAKRGIAHICVFHRAEDWHQNDDFFNAMRACRTYLGPDIGVTAYGFSMGGYGAMLGAPALKADRVVAVSPQSSIDPRAVPFERRYGPQWAAMGGWKHDLSTTISDDTAEYIVLFDPLHRLDRKHEARLPKPSGYTRCLIHGAGHAGLQTLVEMNIQEMFFDLLRGTVTPFEMRHAYRKNRKNSFRYLRKIGTRLHDQKRPMARNLLGLAKAGGHRRLIKKWRPYYE